jgi:hypothetical protein
MAETEEEMEAQVLIRRQRQQMELASVNRTKQIVERFKRINYDNYHLDFLSDHRRFPHLNILLRFDAPQFLNMISTCADAPVFAQCEG